MENALIYATDFEKFITETSEPSDAANWSTIFSSWTATVPLYQILKKLTTNHANQHEPAERNFLKKVSRRGRRERGEEPKVGRRLIRVCL